MPNASLPLDDQEFSLVDTLEVCDPGLTSPIKSKKDVAAEDGGGSELRNNISHLLFCKWINMLGLI